MWGKFYIFCSLEGAWAKELLLLKYVGFASFAILIWDHIDTFPDEVRLLKFLLPWTRYNLTWGIFLQVEYIWKGRKKSICKCGLHCIIVWCLTDRRLWSIQSSTFSSLCVSCQKFHLPSLSWYHSFISPTPRIVISRLWGSLLTSTVRRGYPTTFSIVWYSPNANPAYLSPVWTVDVSPRCQFRIASFSDVQENPTRGPIKIAAIDSKTARLTTDDVNTDVSALSATRDAPSPLLSKS
jgi:hypothetical protein